MLQRQGRSSVPIGSPVADVRLDLQADKRRQR
jgi:hypothetical protein